MDTWLEIRMEDVQLSLSFYRLMAI